MIETNYFKNHFSFIIALFLFFCLACDPEGKKECQWVLEPEKHTRYKPETGYITVCARNRKSMKQDCRLQTKFDNAKLWYGKKFRYTDLKIKSVIIPRTILNIQFCKP